MTGTERRSRILADLAALEEGRVISATALAERYGVSRQVVVGDIALLRSSGQAIRATARGYCIARRESGIRHTVVCCHSADEMERELSIIVDQGGVVEDVTVEHPIYGLLRGELELSCGYDVRRFCDDVRSADAKPLSALTEGIHSHTVRFRDAEACARAMAMLAESGILLSTE